MPAASRSDALVLFGTTGDIAHKVIFPALDRVLNDVLYGPYHWRRRAELEPGRSA